MTISPLLLMFSAVLNRTAKVLVEATTAALSHSIVHPNSSCTSRIRSLLASMRMPTMPSRRGGSTIGTMNG